MVKRYRLILFLTFAVFLSQSLFGNTAYAGSLKYGDSCSHTSDCTQGLGCYENPMAPYAGATCNTPTNANAEGLVLIDSSTANQPVNNGQAAPGGLCNDASGATVAFAEQALGGATILTGADIGAGILQHWLGVGRPFTDVLDLAIRHYVRAVLWGVIASAIIPIIGYLLAIIFALNAQVLNLKIISDIYTAFVGFINVGFVVALVVMAFATMFKNKKLGIGNLPKLIIAAVLINFSFFAARAVLNVGNNMDTILEYALAGQPYDSSASAPPTALADAITLHNRFNVSTITCSVTNYINDTTNTSSGVNITTIMLQITKPLLAITFGSIITLIWAATLLAIAIFFAVRFGIIALLVSVMPISWLSFILPSVKISFLGGDTLSGWWKQFMHWVFFGPFLLFVLYISRQISDWLNSSQTAISVQSGNATITTTNVLFQLVVILLINLIGLYAAVKMSGTASGLITAGIGGGIGWMAQRVNSGLNALSTRSQIQVRRAEAAAREATARGNPTAARWHNFRARAFATGGRVTSGVALPGQYKKILGGAGIKIPEEKTLTVEDQVNNLKKDYAQRSTSELIEIANNPRRRYPMGIPPVEAAALLSYLTEQNQIGNVHNDRQIDMLRRSASIGAERDFLKIRPDLAGVTDPRPNAIDRAANRIKVGESEKIDAQAFHYVAPPDGGLSTAEQLVLGLSIPKLDRIATEGSNEHRENILNVVRQLRGARGALLNPDQAQVIANIRDHINGVSITTAAGTTITPNPVWATALAMYMHGTPIP